MVSTRSRLDEIVASFSTMEDPRSHINRRHPLPSVLVIAVLAVLSGAVAGLIISTVYCRYHYVADVLAGITCAAISVPVGDRIYDAWREREERAAAPLAAVS